MGVENWLHVRTISPSSCGHYNVLRTRYGVSTSSDYRLLTAVHSLVSLLLSRIRSCQTPTHLADPTWRTRRNLSEEILWPTHPRQGYNSKRPVATLERPRFTIRHAFRSRRLSLLSISMVLGTQTRNLRYLPSCHHAFSCIISTNTLHSQPLFRDSRLVITTSLCYYTKAVTLIAS